MSNSVIPSTNAAASTSGNQTGNHVASSFGARTSLGVPSSSFLCNVAGADSSASSFDEFCRRNPVSQGSSDSGNIFRASQVWLFVDGCFCCLLVVAACCLLLLIVWVFFSVSFSLLLLNTYMSCDHAKTK